MAYVLCVIGGEERKFASPIEAWSYSDHWYRQYAGEISGLHQPKAIPLIAAKPDAWGALIPKVEYTPDLGYYDRSGALVYVEVKPLAWRLVRGKRVEYSKYMTAAVILRLTLFRHRYPATRLLIDYREQRALPAQFRGLPKPKPRGKR